LKILVLGAGVLGTTTAYYLASRGHEVEVLERQPDSSLETSFANGGQLSFSHSEPWANPAVLPKVAKWLFKEDAPLIFRPGLDPWMYIWGIRFLLNCTHAKARFNATNILRLGMYSKRCTNVLQQETGIEFDNRKLGILHIFSDEKEIDASEDQAKFQAQFNCPYERKSAAECISLEPSLEHTSRTIAGGIYMPMDESGDVRMFTQALAKYCTEKLGVVFHYNSAVTEIEDRAGRISWVRVGNRTFTADKYVMALGSFSSKFARRMGMYIPVYPMKGYSLTMKLDKPEFAPKISITDTHNKIVYSRLGDRLRVAGTAELNGYNTDLPESRLRPIIRTANELFPKCGDFNTAERWTGLRPATPSGAPILGKSKYDNLYFNTGHGTLGWTMACGSSRAVADIIEDKDPEILMEGLTIK